MGFYKIFKEKLLLPTLIFIGLSVVPCTAISIYEIKYKPDRVEHAEQEPSKENPGFQIDEGSSSNQGSRTSKRIRGFSDYEERNKPTFIRNPNSLPDNLEGRYIRNMLDCIDAKLKTLEDSSDKGWEELKPDADCLPCSEMTDEQYGLYTKIAGWLLNRYYGNIGSEMQNVERIFSKDFRSMLAEEIEKSYWAYLSDIIDTECENYDSDRLIGNDLHMTFVLMNEESPNFYQFYKKAEEAKMHCGF